MPTSLRDLFECLKLLSAPKNVLIIEDHVEWLQRLSAFLTEAGHTVTCGLGVVDLSDDAVTLTTNIQGDLVTANLKDFDVAFLDYYFLGRDHNGGTVTRAFAKVGSTLVAGMSSDRTANETMAFYGAVTTVKKSTFMTWLGG